MNNNQTNCKCNTYPAPDGTPISTYYTVIVEGKHLPVYELPTSYDTPVFFSFFAIQASVSVTIIANRPTDEEIKQMTIHPLSLNIPSRQKTNQLDFKIDAPCTLTILVNGEHKKCPLHLFINPPAEPPPENAIVFGPGKYELGYDNPIKLTSGQTLYLAGGAWVEGIVRAENADNIRIMGHGILFQKLPQGVDYTGNLNIAPHGLAFTNCRNLEIRDIIEIRAIGGWCSLVTNCDNVTVSNYHVLASVNPSSDGFNPCNSRNVLIEDSFFRNSDDCISIKGITGGPIIGSPHIPPATQPPVENITIRKCSFWNDRNNVMVIGAETRTRHIKNILVQDCDILFHNRYFRDLGAFTIAPLHGTEICDITYENIRVEYIENKLFCFRFVEELYDIPGDQSFPGGITKVSIKDIFVLHQDNGARSEFSGWADNKQITNVTVQNLRYQENTIHNEEEMGLCRNTYTAPVTFLPST